MNEISIEIKVIEERYVNGEYLRTYEMLYHLCSDQQCCEQFCQPAMSILTQYNDWEKNKVNMLLDLSQQEMRKRQICTAFETLICQMKKYFNNQQSSTAYEEQAIRMKEQRNMLFKSLMKVEDDLTECGNPNKAKILESIQKQLRQMISCFLDLMRNFRAVKEYE